MDTTRCIENKIWELYSSGQLSEAENHQLSLHVIGCEICTDIKEGIDAMQNPNALKIKVEAIDLKVEKYFKPTKRTISAFWFATAAAVFLFAIGLSWILFKNSDTEVAIKTFEKVIPMDSLIIENEAIKKENKKIIKEKNPVIGLDKEPTGPPQIESFEQATITEEVKDKKSEDITDESIVQKESKSLAESEINETTSDDSKTVTPETTVKTTQTWTFGNTENKEKSNRNINVRKKTTKSASSFKHLPAPVNNNRNTNDFELNSIIENDSFLFNRASLNFKSAEYDSCLLLLSFITEKSKSPQFEDANYLKAMVLINLNRTEEAKIVLQKLIVFNGRRAADAKELLKKLE